MALMISDTHTQTHIHRLIAMPDKDNRIVAGLSWDRLAWCVVIQGIVFNSPLLQSIVPCRASEKIVPENKEARPCVCLFFYHCVHVASSKCVSCISVEYNSHLQPFSSPSAICTLPKALISLVVGEFIMQVHSHTLFSFSWVGTTGFEKRSDLSLLWFHTKFILLFIPLPFPPSLLHLFTEPWLETGTHLHLYGRMYCIDENNYGESLFLLIFQMLTQLRSILQRQASSCATVIAALFSCLWSE